MPIDSDEASDPPWPLGNLKRQHYKVIVIDPPWRWQAWSSRGLQKSPQTHYNCMDLAAIKQLPIAELADTEGCTLLLWATAPMIPEALDTLQAWGFTFKTMAAWAKRSSTGAKWAFGTGYIFRSAAEFIMVGTRGSPKQKVKNVRNLFVAPVREHSRKPAILFENAEALWDGPYAEVFSREARYGWDSFGDEPTKFTSNSEIDTLIF